jgi:hypothetical protein
MDVTFLRLRRFLKTQYSEMAVTFSGLRQKWTEQKARQMVVTLLRHSDSFQTLKSQDI